MKGVRRRWAPCKGHMLGLVHGTGATFLPGFAKAYDAMRWLMVRGRDIFRAMREAAWLGHQSATFGQWDHLGSPETTPAPPLLSNALLF